MKHLNIHDYISNYDLHVLEYHSNIGFYYYKSWSIASNRMLRKSLNKDTLYGNTVALFDRYFQNKMIVVKV